MKLRQLGLPLALIALDIALPLGGAWTAALVWWPVHSAMYAWSCRKRPVVPCWVCGGSGRKNKDWIWAWAEGFCRRCGGRGRFLRWGVHLTPARAERLRAQHRLARRGWRSAA